MIDNSPQTYLYFYKKEIKFFVAFTYPGLRLLMVRGMNVIVYMRIVVCIGMRAYTTREGASWT